MIYKRRNDFRLKQTFYCVFIGKYYAMVGVVTVSTIRRHQSHTSWKMFMRYKYAQTKLCSSSHLIFRCFINVKIHCTHAKQKALCLSSLQYHFINHNNHLTDCSPVTVHVAFLWGYYSHLGYIQNVDTQRKGFCVKPTKSNIHRTPTGERHIRIFFRRELKWSERKTGVLRVSHNFPHFSCKCITNAV